MKILTFDIGGTLIKSAVYQPDSGLSDFCEHPYPCVGAEGVLKILRHVISQHEFDAIGISTAGLVDSEKGEIIFCSNAIPGYTGTPLKFLLESETSRPVFVINDVNAAALGEGAFGAGKGYSDYICLTFGTSIGGAIVLNGKVYEGRSGYAGEIGHTITHPGGKTCICGRRGCYTEYASVSALIDRCQAISENIRNGLDVFANQQNPLIQTEIDGWIDEIVLGLSNVCHIFDPSAILLGGGIMETQELTQEIAHRLKNAVMPGYEFVNVLPAALGNKAGLMGAVENVLRNCEF